MTRMAVFNHPLLLGFEHLERMLERIGKTAGDGYPPYNIEQVGSHGLRITLAVAGFGRDELAVEVEDNQLTVRGKQGDPEDRVFIHRGIAARQFVRTFVLAEGIEIAGARLESGLLHIDLVRPPAESRLRRIEITNGDDDTPVKRRTAVAG